MIGSGSLLACDDDEEFAPLLGIANSLLREMLILGRNVGDWATPSREDPDGVIKCRESRAYATLSGYLAAEHLAAGYATVLLEKEIGLRFSGQPFPYLFHTYATAMPGFPLGGRVPEDPAPPPGAVMYTLTRHWTSLQEKAEREQTEVDETRPGLIELGSVIRGCIHVGRRRGFEAAVRYIYDLVDSGQVLFPATAAQAAGHVLRAMAAIGEQRDLFNDVLGPPPETVRAAIEQEADLACREDPRVGEVPPRVSAVLSELLAACWGRVRQLRNATQAGDWIYSLMGLEALIRFVTDTIRLTVAQPSFTVEAALRQLEEVVADCRAGRATLYMEGFTGFVNYQRSVRSEMVQLSGGWARGESRFRRERLMVPPWILENGPDEAWARAGPACGRVIASLMEKELELTTSPFNVGTGPRPGATRSAPESGDALGETTRLLLQGPPWSQAVLTSLGQAFSTRHPREAGDFFAEALVLKPGSPELWHALQRECRATGQDRAAGVAGRMAAKFSGTSHGLPVARRVPAGARRPGSAASGNAGAARFAGTRRKSGCTVGPPG